MAEIHPLLQQDCIYLGKLTLSHLLLMNDSQYPWLVLVPNRENLTEVFELEEADQTLLWRESGQLSQSLSTLFMADKMNIATMGNICPQLHVHHIVRYRSDISWPAAVWGKKPMKAYRDEELNRVCEKLQSGLQVPVEWDIQIPVRQSA